MAEWIGHLMNGWPTWLIGAVGLVILAVGVYASWVLDFWIWKQPKAEGKKK